MNQLSNLNISFDWYLLQAVVLHYLQSINCDINFVYVIDKVATKFT